MTEPDAKKPVVKAWGDKPVSVENGGHVNTAFDKTNDGEVSPTPVIKFQNNDKMSQPEDGPPLTDRTEAKKKTNTEPVKAVGLFELVRDTRCLIVRCLKLFYGAKCIVKHRQQAMTLRSDCNAIWVHATLKTLNIRILTLKPVVRNSLRHHDRW